MDRTTGTFTGRRRRRAPRRRVKVADRLARWVIRLGGIGSIVAVSLVGAFLVYVAVPLFLPASVAPGRETALTGAAAPPTGRAAAPAGAAAVAHAGLDEQLSLLWTLDADGLLVVRDLADGRIVRRDSTVQRLAPTAWSFAVEGPQCAFGLADGSVVLGEIGVVSEFPPEAQLPDELRALPPGARAAWRGGILQRTPEDQLRLQRLAVDLGEPIRLGEAPVVLVDRSELSGGPMVAALDAGGVLHAAEVRQRRNLLTGEVATTLVGGSLPLPAGPLPDRLLLTGIGDNVLAAWPDGRVLRIDSRDPRALRVVERVDLVPEPGAGLTDLAFLIGGSSLLAGDDRGRLGVWFRIRPEDPETLDGTVLVRARELPPGRAAVVAIAPSARSRLVAAGYADGSVRLMQATTGELIAELPPGAAADPRDVAPRAVAPLAVALSPRDDALLALGPRAYELWRVDAPHAEVDLHSVLGKVWYEGHEAPAYTWQSSSATDAFEPKYSLVPLIFGTLKATIYSLLFGLPLALLAAVYTSEFLHPRARARVKPAIELMASLPSVVLGFLAALVFAPLVERALPAVLTAFVTVPLAFLLGAHLWQLLPPPTAARLERWKPAALAAMLPLGLEAAHRLGPVVERALFAGDVMAWLDGQVGSGLAAWLFFLLPAAALGAALVQTRLVEPWLRRVSHGWTRRRYVLVDLLKFGVLVAAAGAAALLAAWLLTSAGWDPRGGYVGTYVQRNALIVGFVMGFAIIPIIYTIAEDALSAVPDHLRAASLALGATPWQTAVRVIVPPAVSGLFSAVMIGFGRAVGETMIVLMAAGNTPLLDWNVFNGFRTLSANIAVELPEAVRGSTHYRMLFVAALTLFLMTFVLNTAAEAVRLRFRRKAYEL